VRSSIDARFRNEAQAFELRYTCESCAHFDPERPRCANGYPIEPHRMRALREGDGWLFCKEFELL
jgi:hypothetical protein